MLKPDSRKRLLDLLGEAICDECGGMQIVEIEKERVCTLCGLVQNDGGRRLVAGFPDSSHGDPTCETSYGRGLGDTITRKAMFKVLPDVIPKLQLQKTERGTFNSYNVTAKTVEPNDKDLTPKMSEELKDFLRRNKGLRARFMRIVHSSTDPPFVKKALTFGEQFCQEFGIIGEDFAIQFRNFYGKLLKKVCSLAMHMKRDGETFEAKRFALTSFVFTWQLMEIQNRQRKEVHYQRTFPSAKNRKKGLKRVPQGRYKIRKGDWEFVLEAHRISFPTTVLRRRNNGDLNAT